MSASSFRAVEALARQAEGVLARLVGESTVAADLAAELDGEPFTVLVEGLSLGVEITARQSGLTLRPFVSVGEQPAAAPRGRARAATLRATPLDLLLLFRGRGLASLRSTGAQLSGSLDIAEKYAALLEHARPDLEEELSRWVGDCAARTLGVLARRTGAWLGRAGRSLALDTGEYLQEESRALPAAVETRAFYTDVERLRDDVERAAARIELMAARLAARASAGRGE